MQQVSQRQAEHLPDSARIQPAGETAVRIGTEDRTRETESGAVQWKEPKTYLPKSRKAFSPQSQALGLSVDEDLSPAVMQKTVHLATKLVSFQSARDSVAETLEVELTTKRVERLTERVGRERVAQRELSIAEWEELTLVEKEAAPPGIKAPAVVCISADGGRMQRCDLPSTAVSHWCEDKIASLANRTTFGKQLAARAWSLGFAAALLKAFIADGSSTNWGIWQRQFKHQNYVPILDFIHALTYVFSAAMAGRSRAEGEPIYRRWITWVWQGEVQNVIAELATRATDLGPLAPDATTTDPRQIVADTLTYLTNQESRMNYPAYRQSGLPITSSPIESTVKQINQRVKESENFWSSSGSEALLQLRADQLSDTNPLDLFWTSRTRRATSIRNYKTKHHNHRIT